MAVFHTTSSDAFKKLISNGGAIVDFSAAWCALNQGPCKRVEPVFEDLAKKNPTLRFIHVDVDDASDTMPNELSHISGVPHFDVYKDGKKIFSFAGANLNKLKESVDMLNTEQETEKHEEKEIIEKEIKDEAKKVHDEIEINKESENEKSKDDKTTVEESN